MVNIEADNKQIISVIIPVYNAEKTLSALFDDLDNQTYKNFEVILVNDGSKDNSIKVMQEYAQKRNNVTVIDGINHGVSHARNLGLSVARGEFIRFLDSDDRIPEESMNALITPFLKDQEIDLVIANYTMIPEAGFLTGKQFDKGKLSSEEFVMQFIPYYKSFYIGSPCNKLYRKKIFDDYKICFDETIRWCEDLILNINYFQHMKYVYQLSIEGGVYLYINQMHSSIDSNEKKSEKSNLLGIEEIIKYRVEKSEEYCKRYGKDKDFCIYWKYDSILADLAILIKKESGGLIKKYHQFKEILCSEEIQEYSSIYLKYNENLTSKSMKLFIKVIRKHRYFMYYIYYLIKSLGAACMTAILPKMKNVYDAKRKKAL